MTTSEHDDDDTTKTWADVYQDLDQWDAVDTFADRHAQALNTVAGSRRFCSPKIGHLIAHECGDFQMIHHVHQDGNDDIDDDDDADIWALIGAGSTAATVVLSQTGTYDKQTGFNYEWSRMVHWSEMGTSHLLTLKLRSFWEERKDRRKVKEKRRKAPRKRRNQKTRHRLVHGQRRGQRRHRPGGGSGSAIVLPNVIPLPGFLVAALMRAYTSDAGELCLKAIDAIRKRARAAGHDPVESLWRRRQHTSRSGFGIMRPNEPQYSKEARRVGTGLAFSKRVDRWASGIHRRYLLPTLATPAQESSPAREAAPRGVDAVGAEVWTNLANALAIQATAKGAATTAPKKGSTPSRSPPNK
ncbi:hypothetical protein MHU86_21285 [Fragilaria crotonensis]|nr:hypothetical protein MHU86_21285 [Fragilaria crotonensis]